MSISRIGRPAHNRNRWVNDARRVFRSGSTRAAARCCLNERWPAVIEVESLGDASSTWRVCLARRRVRSSQAAVPAGPLTHRQPPCCEFRRSRRRSRSRSIRFGSDGRVHAELPCCGRRVARVRLFGNPCETERWKVHNRINTVFSKLGHSQWTFRTQVHRRVR